MLPIKELSTNNDRRDGSQVRCLWSREGFAEFILVAFITHSVGLSIHPRFTGVSCGRDFSSGPKTCQRAVQKPSIERGLRHDVPCKTRRTGMTLMSKNGLQYFL